MFKHFTLCLFLNFLLSAPALSIGIGDSLGISPFDHYKETLSPHFRVVYPDALSATAARAVQLFEEAHTLLAPKLYWEPNYHVNVLLLDNTDAANGMASAIQRFGVVLYLTPPENWFATSYYDDWLRFLIIHEYTHILNLDATRGVWKALRYVFGDTLLPVGTWPSWMLEGLAVYYETELTQGGRGKSPYWEMILRTAVYRQKLGDPTFVSLDQVGGDNPYFPGGDTRYLFGYHLMNQAAKESLAPHLGQKTADNQQKMENPLGLMSYRASSRFPYFINSNLENIVGKDWQALWQDWLSETQARQLDRIAKLTPQKQNPLKRFTQSGYQALSATPSPDGKWIAYHRDSLDRRSGVYLLPTQAALEPEPSNPGERVADKIMGSQMSWSPDSRFLYFSSLRRFNLYTSYSELGRYDLQTKSVRWLTHGTRAKDPDVSPDGNWIVFTKSITGLTTLARAPLLADGSLGPEEILLPSPSMIATYDRASNPRFSPDGKSVIFSISKNGTLGEDLMSLDLASKKLTTLFKREGTFNRSPAFAADQKLYFISDQSGIYNLWRLESPGHAVQITQTVSGLWMPAFFKDGTRFVASLFDIDGKETTGWDLVISDAQPAESGKPFNSANPTAPRTLASAPAPVATSTYDYSAWRTLAPRQWAPLLFATSTYAYVGGQVMGFDSLDKHSYLAAAAYDTYARDADWVLAYGNRTLGPTLLFSTTGLTSSRETYGYYHTYLKNLDFSASASYPWLWTFSSLNANLEFNIGREYLRAVDADFPYRFLLGQSQVIPYADFSLTYSSLEASKLAVSNERGFILSQSSRLASALGRLESKLAIAAQGFLSLGGHHVLVPKVEAKFTSRRSSYSHIGLVVDGSSKAGLPSLTSGSNALDVTQLAGYGLQSWNTRSLFAPELEYRFPVAYIFRGLQTYPFFLESLTGFFRGTSTYLSTQKAWYPSVGGGLRINTQVLVHLPVVSSLEYHRGLNTAQGGEHQWLLTFGLGAIGL